MGGYARAHGSLGDTRDAIATDSFEIVYKGAVPAVRDFDASWKVPVGVRARETRVDWFEGTGGLLRCGEALFEELNSALER